MNEPYSRLASLRGLLLGSAALLGTGAVGVSCSDAATSVEPAAGSISSRLSAGTRAAHFERTTGRSAVATGVVSFAESARASSGVAGGGAAWAQALVHRLRTPARWLAETARGDVSLSHAPTAADLAIEATPSPALRANFNALTDDGSGAAPPDTDGAVGPNHLMVALNTQIVVQNKSGTDVGTATATADFWKPVLGSNICTAASVSTCTEFSDPHVVYDPYGQRWIFVGIGFDVDPQMGTISNPGILLAVSKTTDPTGGWNQFKVAPPAGVNIPDYPILGFNKDWISVSTNNFDATGAPTGVSIFVFDKAQAYAGMGNGKHTLFAAPNADDFSVAGAFTYDSTLDTLYFVEDFDGTTGTLRLFSVTGAVGSEAFNQLPDVVVSGLSPWADSPPASSNCNFVPQAASTAKICAGDSRITEVSYRNGKLWTANNAYLPANAPTHTAANVLEIDPTNHSVTQAARIEDTTATQSTGTHYFYPAVVPNKYGDAFVGFSMGGKSSAVGVGYSMRFAWDPVSTLRSPAQYHAGTGVYNIGAGGTDPRNRWGDFSIAAVDPSDDQTMWTIQEYTSAANRFGTWWAKLGVDCSGQPDGTPCDSGDACSGTESCTTGTCGCSSGVKDAGADACVPLTKCPAPEDCGTISDGCGGILMCGTCTLPQTCAGGGVPNVCGGGTDGGAHDGGTTDGGVADGGTHDGGTADASTDDGGTHDGGAHDGSADDGSTADASTDDGSTSDASGDDGGADDGSTADASGTDACVPITTCPAADTCGRIFDGCGGTVSCGFCTGNDQCVNNVCIAPSPVDAGGDSGDVVGMDAGNHDSGVGHPDATAADASDDGPPPGDTGGCSCKAAGQERTTSSSSFAAFGALALGGMLRLRRKRR
jgi:MYXO-CTERM domain-containing protein